MAKPHSKGAKPYKNKTYELTLTTIKIFLVITFFLFYLHLDKVLTQYIVPKDQPHHLVAQQYRIDYTCKVTS
jgi:hypothetical protein